MTYSILYLASIAIMFYAEYKGIDVSYFHFDNTDVIIACGIISICTRLNDIKETLDKIKGRK